MSTASLTYAPAQDALTRAPVRPAPVRVPTIQCACACGGSAAVSGKCASCEREEHFGKSLLQPKLTSSTPDVDGGTIRGDLANSLGRRIGSIVVPKGGGK